jgi:HTH-type transcriptional regulator / antitoxin HigA
MQIRPIKNRADHRAALKEFERLMDSRSGAPACDRLEALATFAHQYESQHEPIEPPYSIDALLYHRASRRLTSRNLGPFLRKYARVAEIFNRRRPPSINAIRKVRDELGLAADVLIRAHRIQGSAA